MKFPWIKMRSTTWIYLGMLVLVWWLGDIITNTPGANKLGDCVLIPQYWQAECTNTLIIMVVLAAVQIGLAVRLIITGIRYVKGRAR